MTGVRGARESGAWRAGTWTSAAWSAELGRKARAIWSERPIAESLHGAAKVLHAFGFSLRGARDALLALFFVAAAVAAATLRKRPEARPWVVFFGLCVVTVALQAFVWLPNQRLKTVLFDLPALLILSLAAEAAWSRSQHRRRLRKGAPDDTGNGVPAK
jgi:hypothetical protein